MTNFAYNSGNTVVTNPNGKASTYSYDNQGRATASKDPLNRARSTSWTANSSVQASTDALGSGSSAGNQTKFEYDGLNNATKAELPTGAAASAVYSAGAGCASTGGDAFQVKCSTDSAATPPPSTTTRPATPRRRRTDRRWHRIGSVRAHLRQLGPRHLRRLGWTALLREGRQRQRHQVQLRQGREPDQGHHAGGPRARRRTRSTLSLLSPASPTHAATSPSTPTTSATARPSSPSTTAAPSRRRTTRTASSSSTRTASPGPSSSSTTPSAAPPSRSARSRA